MAATASSSGVADGSDEHASHPQRTGILRLVEPGSSALALYGLMAAGLALAIGVDSSLAATAVIVAVVVELLVFFVAHACVDTLGGRYDHPGAGFRERASHAFRHDIFLLVGGLPILVIFAVERAIGIGPDRAATYALIAATALLGGFSYMAARLAGAPRSRAAGEALVAILLGAAVLLLKVLLK